jgi:uncharacterized protein YqeY
MELEAKIMTQLKAAMLAKDEAALRGLRAIKSAILLEKTSGSSAEFNEEAELKLLQKLVKQRKESLDIFTKQNRADLAEKEQQEIKIIEGFLPAQLSEDEIKNQLQALISEIGAVGIKDMGKAMGLANKHFAGKADGATLGRILKELLVA